MGVWKVIFLSKWVICRFHVNLPGCIVHWSYGFLKEDFQSSPSSLNYPPPHFSGDRTWYKCVVILRMIFLTIMYCLGWQNNDPCKNDMFVGNFQSSVLKCSNLGFWPSLEGQNPVNSLEHPIVDIYSHVQMLPPKFKTIPTHRHTGWKDIGHSKEKSLPASPNIIFQEPCWFEAV